MAHSSNGISVRLIRQLATSVSALAVVTGAAAFAQETGPSAKLFTGCEDSTVLSRPAGTARERIQEAASRTDPISERVFRSFSLDQAAGVDAPEFDAMCWSRLDGVWQEQMNVSFDNSVLPAGWAAETPTMIEFSHGTYTTPAQVVVEPTEDMDRSIIVHSMSGSGAPVRFDSSDRVSIAEALKATGKTKTYRTSDAQWPDGTLTLDVTHQGYIRIKLGNRYFLRPRPEISTAARGEQAPVTDIFTIAYNPKNMGANRQGYDVSTQNPDRFLDNGGKLDIFAPAAARDYYISEQLTVPLGLKLVEEGAQGTVFFERLLASETDFQEAASSSFGFNAGLSNADAVENGRASGGKSTPTKAGLSIGASYAKGEFNNLKESNSVSSITGFQRYKKYALVRDMAFSQLSDSFIDTVQDARKDGNYARLIDKFGTHYPYAVTYGSAGHLTTLVTEEAFSENYSSFKQDSSSGGFQLGPADFSANRESASELTQGRSVQTKFGKTTFSAVGGNGSWSEAGFVA